MSDSEAFDMSELKTFLATVTDPAKLDASKSDIAVLCKVRDSTSAVFTAYILDLLSPAPGDVKKNWTYQSEVHERLHANWNVLFKINRRQNPDANTKRGAINALIARVGGRGTVFSLDEKIAARRQFRDAMEVLFKRDESLVLMGADTRTLAEQATTEAWQRIAKGLGDVTMETAPTGKTVSDMSATISTLTRDAEGKAQRVEPMWAAVSVTVETKPNAPDDEPSAENGDPSSATVFAEPDDDDFGDDGELVDLPQGDAGSVRDGDEDVGDYVYLKTEREL